MLSRTTSSAGARRFGHQFLDRVRGQRLQIGRDALVDAAARELVERAAVDGLDRNAQLVRAGHDRIDARAGAPLVYEPRNAPRFQRLRDWVDAVDQRHGYGRYRFHRQSRAFFARNNRQKTGTGRQRRAAVDGRNRQVELGPGFGRRQGHANRMEQRPALERRFFARTGRGGAKRLAIERAERGDFVGKGLNGARTIGLGTDERGRARGVPVEHERHAIRDLLEPIHGSHGHRQERFQIAE